MAIREVITWHLELRSPEQLAPAPEPLRGLEIHRAEVPSPEFARALYAAVGAEWWWIERLGWDRARWLAHLERPRVEWWIPYERWTPAGFAELQVRGDAVHLVLLGLLPGFTGRGIGPRLIDAAARRAWAMTDRRPRRVSVQTCSLDSPAALAAYEARGFARVAEERGPVALPDAPAEPWPGANG